MLGLKLNDLNKRESWEAKIAAASQSQTMLQTSNMDFNIER